MDAEVTMLRDSVRRMSRRAVEPHVPQMEKHPYVELPDGPFDAVEELGLADLDPTSADGRRMLAAALGALAEASPALAALALADLAARVVARDAALEGRGAFPLYADLSAGEPRPACADGRLHGRCEMVVGAPIARWMVLPATGARGVELAVARTDAEGVQRSPAIRTLGMRGCPTSDVTLDDAPVHGTVELDEERLATLRGPACAIAATIAEGSAATALSYARERVQSGRPIVEHPEVRRMLADVEADAAVCRAAADALCADPTRVGLFVRGREAAARAARDGVQLLGGYGYMEDYPQERRMRDARQASLLLGRGELLRQRSIE